jgi:dolichol-phosphate mannosyltransferase
MDARVVQSLRECREQDRFVRGLVAWTGFRSAAIEYDRPPRSSGKTHYGMLELFFLSLDAFVGFSISPLRLASAAGVLFMLLSIFASLIISIVGSPSISTFFACGLFFLGGVQLLCTGILGEYVGRIYRQSQHRPLYLIAEEIAAPARAVLTDGQKFAA